MAEYIDLDVAVKAFNNFDAGRADDPPCTLLKPEEFAEYLYELPTADVVAVTRCKNCKYLFGTLCIVCGYLRHRNSNDFCSYGEPKEAPMLTITIKANVPAADAQGIKERIAMDIERYGDCKVVSITSDRGREEQMKMEGART